jgi:hypothetical protein
MPINPLALKRFKKLRCIFKCLQGGVSVIQACKAANIDPSTLWDWRKKNARLNSKIYSLVESRIQVVEDQLFKKILEGHATSMYFFLCNRAPDRWHNIADIKNIIYNMNQSKKDEAVSEDRFKEAPRFIFTAISKEIAIDVKSEALP